MFNLFKKQTTENTVESEAMRLYTQAMKASRQSLLYQQGEAPDTQDGRFEMLVLHIALLIVRLSKEGEAGQNLAQALFDVMFTDMDQSLRIVGIGDMGIPRRMKAMMKRCNAWTHFLAGQPDARALEDFFVRNIYGEAGKGADFLVAYTQTLQEKLGAMPYEILINRKVF